MSSRSSVGARRKGLPAAAVRAACRCSAARSARGERARRRLVSGDARMQFPRRFEVIPINLARCRTGSCRGRPARADDQPYNADSVCEVARDAEIRSSVVGVDIPMRRAAALSGRGAELELHCAFRAWPGTMAVHCCGGSRIWAGRRSWTPSSGSRAAGTRPACSGRCQLAAAHDRRPRRSHQEGRSLVTVRKRRPRLRRLDLDDVIAHRPEQTGQLVLLRLGDTELVERCR
jgi:hypothetical protein